ncbi:hypothetical protein FACS189490_09960 [Clostridia bacterium]|nr:hypothetical protein FACS189490_09960 [Clostridia bacterium]
MLKNFAWEIFSKSGDIEAFMTYREIESREQTENDVHGQGNSSPRG